MKNFEDIKFCVECVFHQIVRDPDNSDWFNDDDEAILCKLLPADVVSKSCNGEQYQYKMISGSNRPYQTKKTVKPSWCPYLQHIRKMKISTIND